jgi:hypothetical protein
MDLRNSEIMNRHWIVPEPFLFNPLKHHAGYISSLISKSDYDQNTDKSFVTDLKSIGRSQMDLYTGTIPPREIAYEIREQLKNNGLITINNYLHWIGSEMSGFRTITLSDRSLWILLPGKIPGRWIHFHPGRYSPCTARVRSENLKTAIATLYFCKKHGRSPDDIQTINHVRVTMLGLSPVKNIVPEKGTGRLIKLLSGIGSGKMIC